MYLLVCTCLREQCAPLCVASRQQTMSVLSTTLSLALIHSEASKIGFEKRRTKLLNISKDLLHVVREKQQHPQIILSTNWENHRSILDHVGKEFQPSHKWITSIPARFHPVTRPHVKFSRQP